MIDRRHAWAGIALSAWAASTSAVAQAGPPPAGPVEETRVAAHRWRIPHFFEVGENVRLVPGGEPIDTTRWLHRVLEQDPANGSARFTATAEERSRVVVYSEPDPVSKGIKRYAVVLPQARPCSANDRVAADWPLSADAFHFGVERSRSFGSLTETRVGAPPVLRRLKRLFEPAGTNVQAYELIYEIEGTGRNLLEQKGLVPGLPVSFERFTLYDRGAASPSEEPAPVDPASSPITLKLGLVPLGGPAWNAVESFEAEGYRVLFAADSSGDRYFLAAPLELRPDWYFGGVAADLVVESDAPMSVASARDQGACALFLPHATAGTVFSGKVDSRDEIAGYLRRASAYLAAQRHAIEDLRARGDGALFFLQQFAHAFVESHRSKNDGRALSELPYGDHFRRENALESSGAIRYGADQASALLGLVHYQRKTKDRSILDDIWGLTESSTEASTPSGGVFEGHFDEMLLGVEQDENSGRADVLIDNGEVSVAVNHERLVLRSGSARSAGVTWGALAPVVDGRDDAVDGGLYRFALDPSSIPESVRSDQDSLSVGRIFTRQDGRVRVRETATVLRGVPAARVDDEVQNLGATPARLDEVRLTIGDFFHYGDGRNEVAQNRYGFSRLLEGVPLHVGIWMEGMSEPLWGDNFPPGWVDLTDDYRKHGSRYLVVYGYDKAQVYDIPASADRVLAYNVAADVVPDIEAANTLTPARRSSKDGYQGWTTLQLRYAVGQTLGPGQTYRAPPILSYTLRTPLFSADDDTVPDELQALLPMWSDLMEVTRDVVSVDGLRARLDALPNRATADRLRRFLRTSAQPDGASIVMQTAWMEAADLFAELAATAADGAEQLELERRARTARDHALRGASASLTALTHLRNRFDLMPAYGFSRIYGFHVLLFDWAYRQTGDPRYRDAMLNVANLIATPEAKGGLQITDPAKPNYGAYVLNEFSRAEGANHVDDQGIKLWALRVAYERTLDAKYRRSAELCIDHWIKVRAEDHQFFGITKLFDRYVPTGAGQGMSPMGQYNLLVGLKAWSDLHRHAARLYQDGLRNARERHPVDAIGTTGALLQVSAAENVVHFGTRAELAGLFLLALTFDPADLKRSWSLRHLGSGLRRPTENTAPAGKYENRFDQRKPCPPDLHTPS